LAAALTFEDICAVFITTTRLLANRTLRAEEEEDGENEDVAISQVGDGIIRALKK
jgi:hypothetical protein